MVATLGIGSFWQRRWSIWQWLASHHRPMTIASISRNPDRANDYTPAIPSRRPRLLDRRGRVRRRAQRTTGALLAGVPHGASRRRAVVRDPRPHPAARPAPDSPGVARAGNRLRADQFPAGADHRGSGVVRLAGLERRRQLGAGRRGSRSCLRWASGNSPLCGRARPPRGCGHSARCAIRNACRGLRVARAPGISVRSGFPEHRRASHAASYSAQRV